MKMSEENEKPVQKQTGFGASIRNTIIAGLFIVIPIAVTIWIAYWGITTLTDWAVTFCLPLVPEFPGRQVAIRTVTILLIIIGVFIVGQIAKITLGRKLIHWAQVLLMKLPILGAVYSTCEQIGATVKSSKGGLFKAVVLFEYPRKGCYALGFVTNFNESPLEISEGLGEVYSIFMPTTPNPTSGFLMLIPKSECKILKMTVSEAMTLIVSCGVTMPGKHGELPEEIK